MECVQRSGVQNYIPECLVKRPNKRTVKVILMTAPWVAYMFILGNKIVNQPNCPHCPSSKQWGMLTVLTTSIIALIFYCVIKKSEQNELNGVRSYLST